MSTFNIPILPLFVYIFLKTTQLSCRRKQFNSPPQLENQNHCRRKTTQLSRRKTTRLGTRNETTRISRRKQLNSSEGTKQLNSVGEINSTRQQGRNNSFLHCRRQPAPPTTAFSAESAFSTYS
ncbi:hypothetical protein TNCV_1202921 [Trichonephila clavipes]|nr:hypothetical protein TNCV_1202921 [Trichonephila clavipes]